MIAALPTFQDLLSGAGTDEIVALGLEMLPRLLGALALGTVVALLYRCSRPRPQRQLGFDQTLVLLAPLIAMVTMAVGTNIAAAFTLVGTLAIVRFRTAIRDTRDTAFVIFSVAAGMAMGSGSFVVAALGTVVIGTAILVMRQRSARPLPSAPAAPTAELRLVLMPFDADLGAALRAVESLASGVTILRANADRKSGSLDVRFRLRGVERSQFPELLGRVLELPEVVRANCESDDDADGHENAGAGKGDNRPERDD